MISMKKKKLKEIEADEPDEESDENEEAKVGASLMTDENIEDDSADGGRYRRRRLNPEFSEEFKCLVLHLIKMIIWKGLINLWNM